MKTAGRAHRVARWVEACLARGSQVAVARGSSNVSSASGTPGGMVDHPAIGGEVGMQELDRDGPQDHAAERRRC
jgi:hypothetical protein